MDADVLDNTRGAPTSYAELARVIEALPLLLREARRTRRLSLRAVEEQTGVGYTSLHRIEHGGGYEADTLLTILRWLDGSESNAEPSTPVTPPTGVGGETTEAQEARE
jgi:transcriptional regulator with XRE-family HTH domain